MCYKVLVITKVCRGDEKHMIAADLAWRQCAAQANDCTQTQQWAARCNDLEFEPLMITSGRAEKISKADCRVCSVHVLDDSETQQEQLFTHTYQHVWEGLLRLHNQLDRLRGEVNNKQAQLNHLRRQGERDSAEYADLEDDLDQISAAVIMKSNEVVREQKVLHRLREDREDAQNNRVRNAALSVEEGTADRLFFGNRQSDHVEEEIDAEKGYPRDFPGYPRRKYPQDLVPFYELDKLPIETGKDGS